MKGDFTFMKKMCFRILCCIAAILMSVASLTACGNGDADTTPHSVDDGGEQELGRDSKKDTIPEGLRFDGETVTFFVRDNTAMWKNEIDVEKTTNDTLYDAIYYRNTTVEQRLGVEITQISQLYEGDSWNSSLRNSVLTKSGDYEAAAIYASSGSALAVEGLYYNVLETPYINLKQPWWNKSFVEEVTLFDTLYFLAGDIAISEVASGNCMFFNKDLFEEIYGAQNINLYETVEKQEWTVDRMNELVTNAWQDLDSDGITSEKDIVGFGANLNTKGDGGMDAWIPAVGVSLTKMVDGYPELAFYDDHTVSAFEKLQKLYNNNPGTLRLDGLGASAFIEGRQVFIRTQLDAGSGYRNMSDDYGVLPMPKYDAEQDDYYTNFLNAASLVVILSTCSDTAKVGATLELMAAESYKQVIPAYFEICLKGKYADSPEDAEMYDRILSSFVYSFGYCYSTHSLEGIGSLFRDLNADIAQKYEQNKIKYETSLETLITKLDDISFLVQ